MVELSIETALDKQIEQLLREIEASGIVIIDRDVKKRWIRDLVSKGFSLQMIFQTLKSYNFDFRSTSMYFASLYMSQQKSKEALAEVTTIKEGLEKEKTQKELSAKISWVISAFAASAVGFMTAIMIGNTTKDLDFSSLVGPAGDMLTWFVRGGWIIGFTGLGIGLLLGTFLLIGYLHKRVKKEEAEEVQKKTTAVEAEKKIKDQMAQLAAEIQTAQMQHAQASQRQPTQNQQYQRPPGMP